MVHDIASTDTIRAGSSELGRKIGLKRVNLFPVLVPKDTVDELEIRLEFTDSLQVQPMCFHSISRKHAH